MTPSSPSRLTRHVRVGCQLVYSLPEPGPLMFALEAQDAADQRLVHSDCGLDGTPVAAGQAGPNTLRSYRDAYGNRIWRVFADAGELRVRTDQVFEVTANLEPVVPDLERVPVQHLPDDVIVYTLPSRYCQSDLLLQDAWNLFGHVRGGWRQVQAICDWLHATITYAPGSTSSTSALEAYTARTAVCRDFAHMGISFCRALSIPARYVGGYLPEIGVVPDGLPMDFHAWFQAYLGGAWWTFDARHNAPRTGRIVIATGRDAADVAFSTIYGATRLVSMRVWADGIDESTPGDSR
jgi:transglutaminase-like putative cysteine protease